jgi:hypothetical protein
MIKKILLTLLQFIVFVALLCAGGFWPILRLMALGAGKPWLTWLYKVPIWKITFSPTHFVNINGYIYAAVLLLLILALEAVKRYFRPWMLLTVLAFALAVLISLQQEFGSVTVTN